MGYKERIIPHLEAMVDEIPTPAVRLELAEAIAFAFQWETWRQAQNPPPADTQANRVAFAKDRWAWAIRRQVASWLAEYRRRGDDETTDID